MAAAELTEDQRAGLACLECHTDLRVVRDADAVVVGHLPQVPAQLLACRGDCALRRSGNADGLAENPLPLAIRIGRNDGWAW